MCLLFTFLTEVSGVSPTLQSMERVGSRVIIRGVFINDLLTVYTIDVSGYFCIHH